MRTSVIPFALAVGLALFSCSSCVRGTAPREARVATSPDASTSTDAAPTAVRSTSAPSGAGGRSPRPPFDGLGKLDEALACSVDVGAKAGAGKASAKPFRRASGSCLDKDPFCDTVDVPPPGGSACFVANTNVTRAERESRARASGPPLTSAPWDPKKLPKYWEKVDGHLHLDRAEDALLRANGFVVLDREKYDNYAVAYHDVFQQQLPLYVTVDSVFQAVFRATETLLAEVERGTLGPKLARMIDRLRATLAQSKGVYDADTADDLDLYLVVAHRLLHTTPDLGARAVKPEVDAVAAVIASAVASGSGLQEIEIFGRPRMIDFSQYTPRGHYANLGLYDAFEYGGKEKEQISRQEYFRAMTWLSRLEWNLVSRSCRSSHPGDAPDASETPRETRDAIALADLVARAGVAADLRAFEDVYSVFGGKREDVPLGELGAIAQRAGIGVRDPLAAPKLRAAIGDGYKRTARTHFMPQGSADLPVIATMFGPRIVPDVAPLTHLVHDAVPDRYSLGAADVAYVLGHDRAKQALASDLEAFPGLRSALDKARADVAAGTAGKTDVYSTWLSATLHLADTPKGTLPSFMKTEAYADLKMSSALAAYSQIRHTYVLMAAQGYDAYGCEIPDAYVEPQLAAWDALLAWARAARRAVPTEAKYFRRVEEIVGMLRSISAAELSDAALTEPQRRWLGMVAEITPVGGYAGDSGEPPKYAGWYFDLFPDREIGAQQSVNLVADYFTLTNSGEVRYVGVERLMLGVFVVDVNGEPRMMVGPVARPYETSSPLDQPRLDDEAAAKAPPSERHAPWLASYVAPAKEDPVIAMEAYGCGTQVRVAVRAEDDLGEVSVTLLDHHGDPVTAEVTQAVGPQTAFYAFDITPAAVEGYYVHAKRTGWGRRESFSSRSGRGYAGAAPGAGPGDL